MPVHPACGGGPLCGRAARCFTRCSRRMDEVEDRPSGHEAVWNCGAGLPGQDRTLETSRLNVGLAMPLIVDGGRVDAVGFVYLFLRATVAARHRRQLGSPAARLATRPVVAPLGAR